MAYAIRRRLPVGVARAHPITLGQDDGGGFNWGGFFTNIGTSAASGATGAGIVALQKAIIGAPKPLTIAAPAAAGITGSSSLPVYVWALGGLGLLVVLIMMMKN